jgi:hypothetical protein
MGLIHDPFKGWNDGVGRDRKGSPRALGNDVKKGFTGGLRLRALRHPDRFGLHGLWSPSAVRLAAQSDHPLSGHWGAGKRSTRRFSAHSRESSAKLEGMFRECSSNPPTYTLSISMCIIVQIKSFNSPRHAAKEDFPWITTTNALRDSNIEQWTHIVERQRRWWRGLACALVGLGLLTWGPPSGGADFCA